MTAVSVRHCLIGGVVVYGFVHRHWCQTSPSSGRRVSDTASLGYQTPPASVASRCQARLLSDHWCQTSPASPSG
ncbi:MAG: hypothetical protein LBK25_07230 [Treponema sp.]|nr:hypothetical protein [Treponema sp.]